MEADNPLVSDRRPGRDEAGSSAVVTGYGNGVVRCAILTAHGVRRPTGNRPALRWRSGRRAGSGDRDGVGIVWMVDVAAALLGAHGLGSETIRAPVAP